MEAMRKLEHGDLVHRCFRCGYCKFPSEYVDFNCPSYRAARFDTFSPAGRMWLVRAWMNHELETSPHFAEILYSCLACGNCTEQCVYPRFKDYLTDIFEEAKALLVEEGRIPPPVRDYFKALSVNGNPYRLPQAERGKWAEGTGIKMFSDQEYLFYLGCVGSYDELGSRMARSVADLLTRLGVSFGILGDEETCDGNEVKILGEGGLFEELAKKTIGTFDKKGVKKVITLDPHALNAFRKDYGRLGGRFEAYHYTEILAGLVRERADAFSAKGLKVTYHDPCYLGRHHHIFEPPRDVLRGIAGLELVEMKRNRLDAFCCGGGGGNFFTDMVGPGEDSPARVRVREALETGAEVVAVACPQCAKMLSDAVKAEGLEDRLAIKDVAEIAAEAMQP